MAGVGGDGGKCTPEFVISPRSQMTDNERTKRKGRKLCTLVVELDEEEEGHHKSPSLHECGHRVWRSNSGSEFQTSIDDVDDDDDPLPAQQQPGSVLPITQFIRTYSTFIRQECGVLSDMAASHGWNRRRRAGPGSDRWDGGVTWGEPGRPDKAQSMVPYLPPSLTPPWIRFPFLILLRRFSFLFLARY